jgi:hypothetical protein
MGANTPAYMRAWRTANKEKYTELSRKHSKKCMKRRYDFEKQCKAFRNIESDIFHFSLKIK